MITQSKKQHSQYTSFKARIAIGGQSNTDIKDTPYCFLSLQAKGVTIPEAKRNISPDESASLQSEVISHINRLQVISGPVNPTLEEGESSFSISEQETGKPPTPTDEVRQKHLKADKDVSYKFSEAAKQMQEKFGKDIDELHTQAAKSQSPAERLDDIIRLNEFLAKGMNMEINSESGILDELAKSDTATIFIANHNHVPYDISLAFGTVAELYKGYKTNGRTEDYPTPSFMINKVVPDTLPSKLKEVFTSLESLGVDATPYPTKESAAYNNAPMKPVTEGFAQDKTNLFLFPEGTRTAYNGRMPLEERFQYGVAKLVQDAVQKKGRVRVVSLGIDYENNLGVVNVGNPIYFEKDGDGIKVTGGNITPDTEAAQSNSFYRKLSTLAEGEGLTICHQGKAVKMQDDKSSKFLSRLIAGILCTDMDISAKNATKTMRRIKI